MEGEGEIKDRTKEEKRVTRNKRRKAGQKSHYYQITKQCFRCIFLLSPNQGLI